MITICKRTNFLINTKINKNKNKKIKIMTDNHNSQNLMMIHVLKMNLN